MEKSGYSTKMRRVFIKPMSLGHRFFIFCFTDFFCNKLVSEDAIKINVFPSILIQLENGPNEFYFTN